MRRNVGNSSVEKRFAVWLLRAAQLLSCGIVALTFASVAFAEGGSGNGQGYDGAVYSHFNLMSLCADGGLFDSRLQLRDGLTYETRRSCLDIPPAAQVPTQQPVTFLTPALLLYEGRVYFATLNQLTSLSTVAALGSGADKGNGAILALASGVSQKSGVSQSNAQSADLTSANSFVTLIGGDGKARWAKSHPWFAAALPGVPQANLFADGSALLATTVSALGPAGFDGVWLSRLDPAGNPLWSRALRLSSELQGAGNVISVAHAVLLPSGEMALLTDLSNFNWHRRLLFLRLSSSGHLLAAKVLDSGANSPIDSSGELLVSPAGGMYLAVNVVPEAGSLLLHLSDSGEVIWSKRWTEFRNIKLTLSNSGELLLLGTSYRSMSTPPSIVLPSYRYIRLDALGSVLQTFKWFDDDTIVPPPSFLPFARDQYVAQLPVQGEDSVEFVFLTSNLTSCGTGRLPLSIADVKFSALRTEPVGPRKFVVLRQLNTSRTLPHSQTPIATTVLQQFEFAPAVATSCVNGAMATVPIAVEPAKADPGPGLIDQTGISVENIEAPEFLDAKPDLFIF